jgi:nucleoside-diphosphate-sugar epimerase
VYIDDVCDAFMAVAEAGRPPHRIYNVGSGIQTTVRDLVDVARAELAINASPEWGGYEARAWDARVWVSDPSRISRDLGWQATCDLRTGFARTVAWLRGHRELWSRYGVGSPP